MRKHRHVRERRSLFSASSRKPYEIQKRRRENGRTEGEEERRKRFSSYMDWRKRKVEGEQNGSKEEQNQCSLTSQIELNRLA